jgi:hypothetical protein
MRFWAMSALAIGAVGILWIPQEQDREWTILVAGDLDGYLSPCGCTKPMSGGIRRMATAAKQLASDDRTAFVVNGGLVAGRDRQNEIKAETLAECFRSMGVSAINVGPADARLGAGSVSSVHRLSGEKSISTSLQESPSLTLPAFGRVGPFLIGGASSRFDALARQLNEIPRSLEEAAAALVGAANGEDMVPLLLLQGSLSEAKAIAQKQPDIRLIVYRSSGDPPKEPVRVGETLLVTPGEFAKHLVRLKWRGGRMTDYSAVNLSEDYRDEPEVSRFYKTYLMRVDQEGLLDRLPRVETPGYAGSAACGKCHEKTYRSWKATDHAKALKSLEVKGHSRDPDCVGCHVTGIDSKAGFRSRKTTPNLVGVGCESCHGPLAAHAARPHARKPAPIRHGTCSTCHDVGHSPGFLFPKYWPQIAHPSGKPVDKRTLRNIVIKRKSTQNADIRPIRTSSSPNIDSSGT